MLDLTDGESITQSKESSLSQTVKIFSTTCTSSNQKKTYLVQKNGCKKLALLNKVHVFKYCIKISCIIQLNLIRLSSTFHIGKYYCLKKTLLLYIAQYMMEAVMSSRHLGRFISL